MEYFIGLIVYSLFEYVIGKLKKPKANSALELLENAAKMVIKYKAKNKWE